MILSGYICAIIFVQRGPLLIDKSKVLAETKNWFGLTAGIADYHWLDSNTILHVTESRDHALSFHTLNVNSKAATDSGLTLVFNRSKGNLNTLEVSPNGRKVLWSGWEGKQSKWFVADVSGANLVSFDRRKVSMFISNHGPDDETTLEWGPDSKTVFESLIEFGDDTSTLLWSRSVDSIGNEQRLPTAKGYVDWQPTIIQAGIAFASSGLAIGSERSTVGFITWNINQPQKTRRERTVTVPRNRTISSFHYSHDAKQILWALSVHDPKVTNPWVNTGEEYWITEATGSNWKMVARLPFDPKTMDEQSAQMSAPSWLLDDKAFSFVYMGKLYRFSL
jgi:hypothetical protein